MSSLAVGILGACVRDPETAPRVSEVSGELSEVVPTVLYTTFRSDVPGSPSVRYGYDGVLDQQTPPGPSGTDHTVDVIGLKAGRIAEWQPMVQLSDGRWGSGPVQTVEVPPPPPGLAPLTRTVFDAGAARAGPFHVLTQVTAADDSFVVIVDRDGDYVWIVPSRNPTVDIVHTELAADGRSVLWSEFDRVEETAFGGMFRLSLDARAETFTPMPHGHHDFVELGDGALAYLAFDVRRIEVDGLDPGLRTVQGTAVRRVEEGSSAEPSTLFAFHDDYPVRPWYVCDHMAPSESPFGFYEWDHANSLVVDPGTGLLVVLARNFDSVLWIDPESGALVRELGGRFGVPIAGGGFDHGHLSQVWDGGLMVFDNRLHDERPSRLLKLAVDWEAGTAAEVWSYEDPDGAEMPVLSDADELPDGHVLGTWTAHGRIDEITPDGRVVWQVVTSDGATVARSTVLEGLYPTGVTGAR